MRTDPQGRWFVGLAAGALAFTGALVVLIVPAWDAPWDPIESKEWGWRGLAMNTFSSERTRNEPLDAVPVSLPPAEPAGVTAGEVYENVQVLGDVDAEAFNRLMLAITEWVAPEQGCAHCHDLEQGFASDALYTKRVARVMIGMTQHLNEDWGERHTAPTGVTCYTCHRGQNVPPYHWYKAGEQEPPMGGIVGMPAPWVRTASTIRDFLPREAFERYLLEDHRITGSQARQVQGAEVADLHDLENVYLFMMQVSDGIGANCTFCHNSRAFYDWEQSTPNRIPAWYGIRMTREINRSFVEPLQPILPPERLGPVGDPAKADCMTCHGGANKPLNGVPMLEDYPSLATLDDAVRAELERYLEGRAE